MNPPAQWVIIPILWWYVIRVPWRDVVNIEALDLVSSSDCRPSEPVFASLVYHSGGTCMMYIY